MELARDSISHTVTEIKETVENKVQAVKDTLDWREQFRKRPIAWSAGALGVGFVAGYSVASGIAAVWKDDDWDGYSRETSSYGYSSSRAQGLTAPAARSEEPSFTVAEDEGPGLVQRFKETPMYDNLSKELGSLGNKLVQELSATAHTVVLPFLLSKFKEMIGLDRLQTAASENRSPKPPNWTEPTRNPRPEPTIGR
jgi:hypothetical protein